MMKCLTPPPRRTTRRHGRRAPAAAGAVLLGLALQLGGCGGEKLRVERDRYEVGMSRNLDVLQVQRLLIQAEVDAAAARVDLRQSLTELWRAEGTLLERRRVVLAGDRP